MADGLTVVSRGGARAAFVVSTLVLLVVVLFTGILDFSGGDTRNIQVGIGVPKDVPKVDAPAAPAAPRARERRLVLAVRPLRRGEQPT